MPDELIKTMKIARGVPPVIENAKLGVMSERPVRPRLVGGKTLLMADGAKPETAKAGRGRMAAAPAKPVRIARPTAKRELPEMQPPKPPATAAKAKEGYVRLRLRVSGDQVTVVGAKAVEGPLVERPHLHGSLAYDVVLGAKRVTAGSALDLGERRSFPNESPGAPPEQRGHHIEEVPVYELNVRVPASEVSMKAVPRLSIRLYRIKEDVDIRLAKPGPLGEQFPRELREVGRVSGIKPAELASPLRAELRKALG
jgi:hypothetical protein